MRAADEAGLDGVWVAEHIGFHDAVVPAALYLRETQRLEVGLVGLSTATRHPGMTAMELGKTVLGRHGSTVVVRALKVNGVIEFRRVFRS